MQRIVGFTLNTQQAPSQNAAGIGSSIAQAINPLSMNAQQKWLLTELLRNNQDVMIFSNYCKLTRPFALLFIELAIYRYVPKKYPHERRYGVAGRKLGEGSFGSVYEITHTLKFAADGSLVCKQKSPAKKRAIKVFYSDLVGRVDAALIEATNESTMLTMIGTMNTRQLLGSTRGNVATLMMRYLPGEPLKNLLIEHQQGRAPLTLAQRLILSSMLCAALQKVHQHGVVHRDVKIENIMVHRRPDGGIESVTIIDFNLAKAASRNDTGEAVGTKRYAAPEVFVCQNTTTASDVYSLGRVLWQIWDLDIDTFIRCNDEQIAWCRSLNTDVSEEMTFLFSNTPDISLSTAYKNQIKIMLLLANAIDMLKRPTLNEMKAVFDHILLEMSMSQSQMTVPSSVGQLDAIGMRQDDAPPRIAHSSSSPRLFAHRPSPSAVNDKQATPCVLF